MNENRCTCKDGDLGIHTPSCPVPGDVEEMNEPTCFCEGGKMNPHCPVCPIPDEVREEYAAPTPKEEVEMLAEAIGTLEDVADEMMERFRGMRTAGPPYYRYGRFDPDMPEDASTRLAVMIERVHAAHSVLEKIEGVLSEFGEFGEDDEAAACMIIDEILTAWRGYLPDERFEPSCNGKPSISERGHRAMELVREIAAFKIPVPGNEGLVIQGLVNEARAIIAAEGEDDGR